MNNKIAQLFFQMESVIGADFKIPEREKDTIYRAFEKDETINNEDFKSAVTSLLSIFKREEKNMGEVKEKIFLKINENKEISINAKKLRKIFTKDKTLTITDVIKDTLVSIPVGFKGDMGSYIDVIRPLEIKLNKYVSDMTSDFLYNVGRMNNSENLSIVFLDFKPLDDLVDYTNEKKVIDNKFYKGGRNDRIQISKIINNKKSLLRDLGILSNMGTRGDDVLKLVESIELAGLNITRTLKKIKKDENIKINPNAMESLITSLSSMILLTKLYSSVEFDVYSIKATYDNIVNTVINLHSKKLLET